MSSRAAYHGAIPGNASLGRFPGTARARFVSVRVSSLVGAIGHAVGSMAAGVHGGSRGGDCGRRVRRAWRAIAARGTLGLACIRE